MDNPYGNHSFPPPHPQSMSNPPPMSDHPASTFAQLVNQLNFSNMTIANLSQQVGEMRAELQALRADNNRLSNELLVSRTYPTQPMASTPNRNRDRWSESVHGDLDYENDQRIVDGGAVRREALSSIGENAMNEVENGAFDGGENGRVRRERRFSDHDRRQTTGEQLLTVTEVESAFYEFSGTEVYSVEKWISDFDEMADSIGLTNLRRFVLAKKKLTGLAKLFLGTVSHITSWNMLKEYLLEEFRKKENSAVVHETLRSRKRKVGENVLEYFLVIREIGAKANLDFDAIMTHTINGINDNGPDKTLLYGARTREEFREKLRMYQSLKDSKFGREGRQHNPPAEEKYVSCRNTNNRNSYSRPAGSKSGTARSTICYRCGFEGHIAKDCVKKLSHGAVNVCHSLPVPMKGTFMEVKINTIPVRAFFDSGSDVSLMRADWGDKFGLSVNTKEKKKLTTLNGSVWTMGTVCLEVEVENMILPIVFDILEAKEMPQPVLIGRNMLLHGDVNVTAEGAKFQPKDDHFAMRIMVEDGGDEALAHIQNSDIREEVRK